MISWIRSWLPLGPAEQWVVGGFFAGLALLVLVGTLRSIIYIWHYGFWNWLRGSFRIDEDAWRLIGVLFLLVIAAAMVFTQWV